MMQKYGMDLQSHHVHKIIQLFICNIISQQYSLCFFSITDCYDPSGIGDGICDDYSNNKACNYDQGDCCTGIKGVLCNICECKQSSTDYPVITTEWDPYLSK